MRSTHQAVKGPPRNGFPHFSSLVSNDEAEGLLGLRPAPLSWAVGAKLLPVWGEKTTLSGGSLGSCVDEERSQLRELM